VLRVVTSRVLGVLGVPLITVPDSSPRASKGVLVLAWRLCRIFCEGTGLSRLYFVSVGAPEASEEWFDSSEVLMLFVMPRPAWLFPHAALPQPGCMVRFRVFRLVC
jgi:hypothetical protein